MAKGVLYFLCRHHLHHHQGLAAEYLPFVLLVFLRLAVN